MYNIVLIFQAVLCCEFCICSHPVTSRCDTVIKMSYEICILLSGPYYMWRTSKNIYIILCIFALYHLYARQKESSPKDNFYVYNVVFLDLLKRVSVRKNWVSIKHLLCVPTNKNVVFYSNFESQNVHFQIRLIAYLRHSSSSHLWLFRLPVIFWHLIKYLINYTCYIIKHTKQYQYRLHRKNVLWKKN